MFESGLPANSLTISAVQAHARTETVKFGGIQREREMDRPASRRRHNSQRRLQQPGDESVVAADTLIPVQREGEKRPARPSAGSQTGETKPGDQRRSLWPLVGFVCCISTLLIVLGLAARWQQGAVPNIFDIGILRPSSSPASSSPSTAEPWSSRLHPEDHVFRPETTVTLEWSVSTGYRRLDGVKKRVYLINGKPCTTPYLTASHLL